MLRITGEARVGRVGARSAKFGILTVSRTSSFVSNPCSVINVTEEHLVERFE
jgi:hypothetical protein